MAAIDDSSMGIGKGGQLPWKTPISSDMMHFKTLTIGKRHNAVIMGRKTWESIPKRFRPLKDRLNVIVSSNPRVALPDLDPHVLAFCSFSDAVDTVSRLSTIDDIFIIGGGQIYEQAVVHPKCTCIELTRVTGGIDYNNVQCDIFFPRLDSTTWVLQSMSDSITDEKSGATLTFCKYTRNVAKDGNGGNNNNNAEEQQYLQLIKHIIDHGTPCDDRTGTWTLSVFGAQMRFSLRGGVLPLLTTKRVFWRGVVEELLWFIKGCTDAKELASKGVHIWDANGSREFLDKLGYLQREEGDLGPVYGFQWRHFGAEYVDHKTNYHGKGLDQLVQCIASIKTNPNDRRIIMTAWNPCDLAKVALPPCHTMCQFYVAKGELSCQMYQRSADMGLGVPFNIASYALLTHLMAHVCGLEAGDFVHTIGDAHV
ncbi:MAG TPA: thymidylate synthase, partial [Pseudomonadales bacterium]|nr:thymidylate synthase [Pseudomonadales bacterium]